MRAINLFSILILVVLTSCNDNVKIPHTTSEDSTIITVDKILAAKPKFPGYFPTSYILGDTSYIRIVCNRNTMEKVWMVYFDSEENKWKTLVWIGSGDENKIIADTIFCRRTGVKGGHSSDDAPEFYMASSIDSGKNWEAQHNYETFFRCKNELTKRSYLTTVLVANDYMNESGKHSVAIIIQNKKQGIFKTGSIEGTRNFDFLCSTTRKF